METRAGGQAPGRVAEIQVDRDAVTAANLTLARIAWHFDDIWQERVAGEPVWRAALT